MEENKEYLVICRCRKCGQEFTYGSDNPLTLIKNVYKLRNNEHNCPKKISKDEIILMDAISYMYNPNYKGKGKEKW